MVNKLAWQYPVITEKQAFLNHEMQTLKSVDDYYLAFPWATMLDLYRATRINSIDTKDISSFLDLNCYINLLKDTTKRLSGKNIHTVCQHIRWKELIQTYEIIGITDLHISHLELTSQELTSIKLHSWPIVACNKENLHRNQKLLIKLPSDKTYLTSFIGTYNNSYRSDIRFKLYKLFQQYNNCLYILNNKWFYQNIVYKQQIEGKFITSEEQLQTDNDTIKYNETLSNSIFALCPEGTGPNTIRLWESMSVGTIPVIYSDDWVPPSISEFNWSDFSITIPTSEYMNTIDILKSIHPSTIKQMQINCLNAYHIFSNRTCFK